MNARSGDATAPKNPMKAITYHEYGGPEVLQLEEVGKPVPKDDQVLVRVRAAALNPYDMHFLHGTPYFMRLMGAGLRKPKSTGIGVDFSGVVESVGKNVTRFKPSEAVFGGHQGALSEYIVISEPGERLNDSSTGLEGERLAWAHKSRSFCSSSSDALPEKTITWGVCSSLKTPPRQFTSSCQD